MADRFGEGVVRSRKEDYGDRFANDLIEQYKLYVNSAENVSARRIASSRLFLALNAGLVALYGIQPCGFARNWWAMAVPLVGVAVCLLWDRIIRSHRDLNSVKFDLIHEMEQYLPARPYTSEWRVAEQGRGKTYREVTGIERWLPWTFLVLHVVLLVVLAVEVEIRFSILPE